MADSKFFGIPFSATGDKAVIPEDAQPSGAVSYTQGFGPDYERDPATDPLAKRVPRDETNELYYQLSNAIKFLQLYGYPEWYALDDNGDPVSYSVSATVRHDAGAGMQVWRSLVNTNTVEPGTDPAKWTLSNAFDLATLEASLAAAIAGLVGTSIITPRRMASASQRNPWRQGTIGGTANALTMTLAPAPSVIADLLRSPITGIITTANTGAVTLNVNGFGAVPVKNDNGTDLSAGDLPVGAVATFTYDGTNFQVTFALSMIIRKLNKGSTTVVRDTAGTTTWTPPAGVTSAFVRVWGGGGGGGGSQSPSAAGGGGGGGYTEGQIAVTPGVALNVVVGAAGTAGASGAGATDGGAGGTSSFSTLSATGGGGGVRALSNTQGSAGLGGVGSGGARNVSGGTGSSGTFVATTPSVGFAGQGGAAAAGGGPGGGASTGLGGVGQSPGGGGGGGAGGQVGRVGAAGTVIIEYFAP